MKTFRTRSQQETARHETYAKGRRLAFVGRNALLRLVNEHVWAGDKPVVLTGDSGSGKSSLMAEWVARWGEDHPDDLIIQHYVGSTPASADWQCVVRRIVGEIKRAFAIRDEVPAEVNALRTALHDWIGRTGGSRVVIALDALNQLADTEAAGRLGWLPSVFPANVQLIVSSLPGDSLDVVRNRGWREVHVPPFERADIASATVAYFRLFAKTPPPDVMSRLETTSAASNALYLRAVLDELRQFGRHEELAAMADAYLSAPDLPELFDRILSRWHEDFGKEREHPEVVRHSLCLIACSRFGLSEAELLDLLGWKNAQGEDEPMPRRFWTPFYLAAENALAMRAGLLNFGHDALRAAVRRRYLSDDAVRYYRAHIGAYFVDDKRTHWSSSPVGSPIVNRVLDEVPWQLAEDEAWEPLHAFLTHLPLLSAAYQHAPLDVRRYWARLEKRSPFRLTESYRRVLENPEEHLPYLRSVSSLLAASGNVRASSGLLATAIDRLRTDGNPDRMLIAIADQAANLNELGDYRGALALLQEGEEICRDTGSQLDLAQILGEKALNYQRLGELDRALELLVSQEETCRRWGAQLALANCLANQAIVHLDRRDPRRALELQHEVEELRNELGDLHGLADSLLSQAGAHHLLGDSAKARSLLARHRRICRTIGHAAGLADGLSLAAEIERSAGRPIRSRSLLAIAATLDGSLGRKVKLAVDLAHIARLFQEEGRLEEAAGALGQSLSYFVDAGDVRHAAVTASHHAAVLSGLHRHREALASLDAALGLDPPLDVASRLHAVRAEALFGAGEPQAVLAAIETLSLPVDDGKDFDAALLALRSRALRELGRTDESLAAIGAAEELLEAAGARGLLVEALILHARILIFDKRSPAVAAPVLGRARAIADSDGLAAPMQVIAALERRIQERE